MLTLAASSAAACSVSTPSAKAPINLPELPKELYCDPEKDETCAPVCPYATEIPDRDINQSEAEKLWRQDRVSLKTCRDKLTSTVKYYQVLRSNLSAPEPTL